jgi:hypothetical protein
MRKSTSANTPSWMPPFVVKHRHPGDRCPAANPQMAPFLLKLLSNANAKQHGIRIEADAVTRGQHHLFEIVEGPGADAVREYLAPFAQAGSLEVTPASNCEEVIERGAC